MSKLWFKKTTHQNALNEPMLTQNLTCFENQFFFSKLFLKLFFDISKTGFMPICDYIINRSFEIKKKKIMEGRGLVFLEKKMWAKFLNFDQKIV
jgi:hypothetical protein